jgi:catechol 2,3-dioxygenase-like lactoylglutathione lyase family enzyme
MDHVIINVSQLQRSKEFYAAALAGLDLELAEAEGMFGFGAFWIAARDETISGLHVAFAFPDRSGVDAFHAAAVAAGGTDNGAPGLRPDYGENYYAAFVFDPDGVNVEAVCHAAD